MAGGVAEEMSSDDDIPTPDPTETSSGQEPPLPSWPPNPFVVTRPVVGDGEFFGRRTILDRIKRWVLPAIEAHSGGRRLVVAIDEVEFLEEKDLHSVEAVLRALAPRNNASRPHLVLLAWGRKFGSPPSAWLREAITQEIGPFQ